MAFDLDLEFPPTTFPPPLPEAPQPLVATTASPSLSKQASSDLTNTVPAGVDDKAVKEADMTTTSTTSSSISSPTSTTSTTSTTTTSPPSTNTPASTSSIKPHADRPPILNKGVLSHEQRAPPSPENIRVTGSPTNTPSSPPTVTTTEKGPTTRGAHWLPFRSAKPRSSGGFLGEATSRGRGWIPTRPPRSLDHLMSDDGPNTAEADKEYVALLERQLRDLRARVKACRSCLTPPQRTMATCGGGRAWKEHRRRERKLRSRQRAQRRERRRRIKSLQGNSTLTNSTTPTPTTTTTTTTTTEEADPLRNPLQADVSSWFSESDAKAEGHRVRQNYRMSTDFRRGFNQKISRMDEALMQFTDTQAAFCKELRDNLGGRLEKRGQELGALSNQIAALVRTSTKQISELEKVASDQLYSNQASIEKSIAITQAIRDSQIRAIQNYHKQTFLPAAAAIATILSDQASAVTSMGVEIITKVEMLQDVYLTYATQQADNLQKVSEDVDMFASKHTNLVMRSKDHANHLHINTEAFIRELQTRMNNVVKELVLIRLQSQNFVSINNNTHNDIFTSLNKTDAAVDNLSQGLRQRVQNAKDKENDFRATFKMETNRISDRVESGISQALVSNHASVSQIEDTELDTRVYVGTAIAAWNELYLEQEAELRLESDSLTNSLRSHTHHTQNILTDLRSAAETHEQVLEEQRMDFQRFVNKRQDALDNQCSAITDWAMLMSSELRRRDEDLHRFLNEDLQYTTVTVHEDTEGYLVSRLPDGSLVYQSSPAHAAHPPPNVTYQLDETVYSTEPASSTSHSSPPKPQLEKTVKVTSVNSTNSSLRESINLGKDGSTNNDTGTKDNGHNNITITITESDVSSSSTSPDQGWKLTEKYDILEETDNRINDGTGKSRQKEEIDFGHHGKTPHRQRSSSSKVSTLQDTSASSRDYTTEAYGVASALKGQDPRLTDGHPEATHIEAANPTAMVDTHVNETRLPVDKMTNATLKKGERRQNDGAYEQKVGVGCGSMAFLLSGNEENPLPPGQGLANQTFYDDDDKGIKKLRKILKEAQRTIEKFQMDFKIDDSFRKNKPPLKLWTRLQMEEELDDEGSGDLEHGATNETSTISPPPSTNHTQSISNTTTAVEDGDTPPISKHRIRHHRQKSHRRVHKGLSGLFNLTFLMQDAQNSSSPALSSSVSNPAASSQLTSDLGKNVDSSELEESIQETIASTIAKIFADEETDESQEILSPAGTDPDEKSSLTPNLPPPQSAKIKKKNDDRLENETTTTRSTGDN